MIEYIDQQNNLISIKTKKHKSLGVLTLYFIRIFLEKQKILLIDEVIQSFNQNINNIIDKDQFEIKS